MTDNESFRKYKEQVLASVDLEPIESGEKVMFCKPSGYLSAAALRIIADHLDECNAPLYALWQEQFEKDAQTKGADGQ